MLFVCASACVCVCVCERDVQHTRHVLIIRVCYLTVKSFFADGLLPGFFLKQTRMKSTKFLDHFLVLCSTGGGEVGILNIACCMYMCMCRFVVQCEKIERMWIMCVCVCLFVCVVTYSHRMHI